MSLPPEFLSRAKNVIVPHVTDKDMRDVILTEAFYILSDSRLYHQIERDGNAVVFTVKCLKQLVDYGCLPEGEHAAARLLAVMHDYCGPQQHPEIGDLIALTDPLCAAEEPEVAEVPVDEGTVPKVAPDRDAMLGQVEQLRRKRKLLERSALEDGLPQALIDDMIAPLNTQIERLLAQLDILPAPEPTAPAPEQTIATPQDELQPTVFISYSRDDADFAKALITDIQNAGHAVWVDTSKIKGGDDWIRTIAEGINNSYAVVVVTSRRALSSRWTRNEILWAQDKNKLIVPVLIEAPFDDPNFILLRGEQGIKFYEGNRSDNVRALLNSLPRPRLPQVIADDEPEPVIEETFPVETALRSVPRRLELAYLERLKLEELLNTDKYTPLAGESQVNTGAEMPTLFELLPMRRGNEPMTESREFENAVDEIRHLRRAVLLGEPGGGKTTTVWKLARDLVDRAEADKTAPIPVLVRLGKWTDANELLTDFIRGEMGELGDHLDGLLDDNRAALLLDGLNEIPVAQRNEKSRELQAFIEQHADAMAVVSCREQDYTIDLGFDKINITPLDPLRIREFATRYLGEEQGEVLFWKLAGQSAANQHNRFMDDVGDKLTEPERVFWIAQQLPDGVEWEELFTNPWRDWLREREKPSSLMVLARNPYMLLMLTSVYAEEGDLPENRGELFQSFVETLLLREQIVERHPTTHKAVMNDRAEKLLAALANVAYEMQVKRAAGNNDTGNALTVLPVDDVREIMGADVLYLAGSASVLSVGDEVRFTHQLLQEYFAALYMDTEIKAGRLKAVDIWRYENWWERTNWEEAAILLAGLYSKDCSDILRWVASANPEVAAQCANRSGSHVPDETLIAFREQWLPRLTDLQRDPMPEARAAVGRALGQLILSDGTPLDNRKGVSVIVRGGIKLPDIAWVTIASAPFIYQDEQHPALPEFDMSRFPVTYAQFQCFVDAVDFENDVWWAGIPKQYIKRGHLIEQTFQFVNHPRETVSWYQAVAFTRWLSAKTGDTITLPTEQQFERAARGTDGLIYPYGNEFDAQKGNTRGTGIGQTSAVGIFPQGASPEGVLDLSGNVWTWCLNKYDEPEMIGVDDSGARRVLRGGAWSLGHNGARSASRLDRSPFRRLNHYGFLLCRLRPPQAAT